MSTALELVGPRSGSAPYVYTVAETGTFDPMTVHALFNGAGAAATFKPCLTIKAQDGTIIARVFPGSDVAAGDSSRVTFAPFLRSASASGAGITSVISPNGTIAVTNGGGPTVSIDTSAMGVAVNKGTTQLNPIAGTWISWDGANWDTSGGAMWSAGAPTDITITVTGLYAVWASIAFKLDRVGSADIGIQSEHYAPSNYVYVGNAGDFQQTTVAFVDKLDAPVTVRAFAMPNGFANLTVNASGGTSTFGATRIG